jgi:hypothetical protein
MAKSVALLGVIACLVAACGPSSSTPPQSAAPSQSVAASPSSAPSSPAVTASPASSPSPSAATGSRPCTADDVQADASEWGGAAGSRGADVAVTNRTGSPCVLPASPRVVMLSQSRIVLESKLGAAGAGPMLVPGGSRGFSVQFSNWCDDSAQLPFRFALLLGVGSAKIGDLEVSTPDQLPPCNGPGQPPSLSTDDWQPA